MIFHMLNVRTKQDSESLTFATDFLCYETPLFSVTWVSVDTCHIPVPRQTHTHTHTELLGCSCHLLQDIPSKLKTVEPVLTFPLPVRLQ